MAFNPQEIGNKIKTEATNAAAQASKAAIEDSVSGFLGSAVNFGKTFATNFANDVKSSVEAVFEPFNFASKLRGQDLPKEDAPAKVAASAEFSSDTQADWRVRLSVPSSMSGSSLLQPLSTTQNSLTFPLTPSVIISHSANYNSLQPVHTNYPFQVYENSSTDDMTITGEFPVENDNDGRYWVACMHYLRSVTKMNYGTDGSPPPVVRLNGYGDYIFKNVPVVISNFTVDLPVEVDYIAVGLNAKSEGENDMGIPTTYNSSGTTWVPTMSQITITCKPTYSRRQVSQFDLNQFVNGNYVLDGRGFI
jgi:hypothetical protein